MKPFNAKSWEVRAWLEGRKTQTRRAVKWPLKSIPDGGLRRVFFERDIPVINEALKRRQRNEYLQMCPFGQPGDRLWVRETWAPDPPADHKAWDNHSDNYVTWSGCGSKISGIPPAFRSPKHCIYREGWNGHSIQWTPSIHMPRWASRLTLEITAVRVERLQDIREEGASAEGVHWGTRRVFAFQDLWQSTYGHESWDANPWVWVVETEVVT